jgi:PPOX class F420-dependent enzyme/OxyR family protein/uncharacterized protein (TIGR02246 family)
MHLDEAHARYLASHHQGRLATVAPDGTPHNKPVGYRYNAELGTIDIDGFNMAASAKYRNIATHPDVAFVVDDAIGQGAAGMRFVEIRGFAEQSQASPPRADDGLSSHIIRIHPRRVVSWNVDADHPGLQTHSLAPTASADDARVRRPRLGADTAAAQEATAAVTRFVGELQAAIDTHNAETYNQHFADDVTWGSPLGEVVLGGYDELHAIHTRLHEQRVGGPSSRYEIVDVRAPMRGVALAHVRRVALDRDGQPVPPTTGLEGPFSEIALYVLVRRGRDWWLAAGQNTPIRLKPSTEHASPTRAVAAQTDDP